MLEGGIVLESGWGGDGVVVVGWKRRAVLRVDATLEPKIKRTGSMELERGSRKLLLSSAIARELQASFLVEFLLMLKDQT